MDGYTTVEAIARVIARKLQYAQRANAVYFDEDGNFKVAPINGTRYRTAVRDFPDAIVGIYSAEPDMQDIYEDVIWFCRQMGMHEDVA